MRKAKVRTDFSKTADSEIDNEAAAIILALTGNANFTLTDVGFTLVDLTGANGTFISRKSAAASRDRVKIASKNTAKRTLITILGHIGRQVNEQANGDVTKLESSGYAMAGTGEPVHPPKPTGQKLDRGENEGDIKCQVDPFTKGYGYMWYFTLASNTEADPNHWDHQFSTGHITTIHDCTSGSRYKVCCAYQGSHLETYVFSDFTEIIAP